MPRIAPRRKEALMLCLGFEPGKLSSLHVVFHTKKTERVCHTLAHTIQQHSKKNCKSHITTIHHIATQHTISHHTTIQHITQYHNTAHHTIPQHSTSHNAAHHTIQHIHHTTIHHITQNHNTAHHTTVVWTIILSLPISVFFINSLPLSFAHQTNTRTQVYRPTLSFKNANTSGYVGW